MLPMAIEERSPVVQVIERTEGRYGVWEEFGEVRGWRSLERVVLECNCRARLILQDEVSIRRAGLGVLECGICGERFVLTRRMPRRGPTMTGHRRVRSPKEEHRYSWLEDYLGWLEGKEARHEYYARLEERTVIHR